MGKTKEILKQNDQEIVFYFKDEVTGEGEKIDPGANEVIGEIAGKGNSSLLISTFFFEKLEREGIPTHFISADIATRTMRARRADIFGNGLEFVCRRFAYGSFVRRYGDYVEEMTDLPCLVEVTLKDDQRGDPLINDDALIILEIITLEELQKAKSLTRIITAIISNILKEKGLTLIDIKFEFGKVEEKIVLIDEVSGDSMRVEKKGKILNQIELYQALVD